MTDSVCETLQGEAPPGNFGGAASVNVSQVAVIGLDLENGAPEYLVPVAQGVDKSETFLFDRLPSELDVGKGNR